MGECMIRLAVVFDGAGVLYIPFRIIKNIDRGIIKRSRVSGLACTDRLDKGAMVILKTKYVETMEQEPESELLSDLIKAKKIESKVVYKREGINDSEVVETILGDKSVTLKDIHETMSFLKRCDILPLIGIGLIADMTAGAVKYVIAGALNFFPETRKLIRVLSKKGIALYIASGDRIEGGEMAVYLPEVPPENIFGMLKPEDKRDLVAKLKRKHKVMMVGDNINDYLAFCEADIAVLSLQEEADRPGRIFEIADFRIKDIGEIEEILEEIG
ncbi:MAG: HAD family hydrolase [Halobacteriota archaeon]